jgi:general stress protein 26
MTEMTIGHALAVTRATMEAAEFCFLVTLSESGPPNARVMQPFGPDDDLDIWFGASLGSRKVREIERDPRCTVGYEYGEDGAYVTLLGTAEIVADLETRQRYWRESFEAFWPHGPESDDYVAIRFVPRRIEVMNIEYEIAPEPFGLRPLVLVRSEAGWAVEET